MKNKILVILLVVFSVGLLADEEGPRYIEDLIETYTDVSIVETSLTTKQVKELAKNVIDKDYNSLVTESMRQLICWVATKVSKHYAVKLPGVIPVRLKDLGKDLRGYSYDSGITIDYTETPEDILATLIHEIIHYILSESESKNNFEKEFLAELHALSIFYTHMGELPEYAQVSREDKMTEKSFMLTYGLCKGCPYKCAMVMINYYISNQQLPPLSYDEIWRQAILLDMGE